MPKHPPTRGRAQALRHIMQQIDQGEMGPAPMQWGQTEGRLNPEFQYPGDPMRNPFEAPMPVMQERARPASSPGGRQAFDARGIEIAPQILQAMELMRARQAMGFQTDGQKAEAQARARGAFNPSPLWG